MSSIVNMPAGSANRTRRFCCYRSSVQGVADQVSGLLFTHVQLPGAVQLSARVPCVASWLATPAATPRPPVWNLCLRLTAVVSNMSILLVSHPMVAAVAPLGRTLQASLFAASELAPA
jgi:hypothetical protein